MAKLRVSDEALLQVLFPDQSGLTLTGVQFDPQRCELVLDLSGPSIPEVDEVVAIITKQSRTTSFVSALG